MIWRPPEGIAAMPCILAARIALCHAPRGRPPAPAERKPSMPQLRPTLLGALLLALPAAPALADTTVGCVTTAWKLVRL